MTSGAHFGHKKERSHPKSRPFTYTLREGIYIIDLQKTQEMLQQALIVLAGMASAGKTILFVGTKPQAADIVKAAAQKSGMPYLVNRWPGGLLTNFETVLQNLKNIDLMEAQIADPLSLIKTKKEKRVLAEKIHKSNDMLGGIRELKGLPDALFVVDAVAENTAVTEATKLGLPIIAICDTNANPERIAYPIPANDDANGAIELIVGLVSDVIAGNKASMPVKEQSIELPKPVVQTMEAETATAVVEEETVTTVVNEEVTNSTDEVASKEAKQSKSEKATPKTVAKKPTTKKTATKK